MDVLLVETAFSGLIVGTCIYLGAGVYDVSPDQRLVVRRFGRVRRVAGAGKVLTLPFVHQCKLVDMRPFELDLDVPLTLQDGAPYMAHLVATCRVLQPEQTVPDHQAATREALEAVLRTAAADMKPKEIISTRANLGRGLKKAANERALGWGVDIQSVELVSLKEVSDGDRAD